MAISRGNIPRNMWKDDARCIKTYQSTQIQHQKAPNRYDTEKQPYAGSDTTVQWPNAGKIEKIENFKTEILHFES